MASKKARKSGRGKSNAAKERAAQEALNVRLLKEMTSYYHEQHRMNSNHISEPKIVSASASLAKSSSTAVAETKKPRRNCKLRLLLEESRKKRREERLEERREERRFRQQNSKVGVDEIDLHGLNKATALSKVEQKLEFARRKKIKRLSIITGRGSHSFMHVPVIKTAVCEFLDQQKLKYEIRPENEGRVEVRLRSAWSIAVASVMKPIEYIAHKVLLYYSTNVYIVRGYGQ